MDKNSGGAAKLIAAVLGSGIGAVALFVGLGFAVEDSFRSMLGLPAPPFATADYLRAAGTFLMEFGAKVGVRLLIFATAVLGGIALVWRSWPPRRWPFSTSIPSASRAMSA